jgi:hypothetical protein
MISAVGSAGDRNLFSAPLEGIRRGVAQMAEAGEKIANGEVNAENMVELSEAKVMVQANSVSLRAADQTVGSLLNVLA